MDQCYKCNAPVSGNVAGLNKKIVNRSIEKYMCIDCLAEHFQVDKADLLSLIERLKKAGCTLFR